VILCVKAYETGEWLCFWFLLILDWYCKETFSGRYLSFFSEQPKCHKIGIIFGLVDRAILLLHPIFHQKNLKFVINILINNGYPLNLIFNSIWNSIKIVFATRSNLENHKINKVDNDRKIIAFPYIKNVSEIETSAIDKKEFLIGYRCLNRLNDLIKRHKIRILRIWIITLFIKYHVKTVMRLM